MMQAAGHRSRRPFKFAWTAGCGPAFRPRKVEFPIDGFSKHCLVEGVDELGYILQHEAQIAAYEARRVGSIDTRG